jgi:hypothetical protein
MIKVVDPYFKMELDRLRAELAIAQRRTVAAFPVASLLEGPALGRLLRAHKKEVAVMARIQKLCER